MSSAESPNLSVGGAQTLWRAPAPWIECQQLSCNRAGARTLISRSLLCNASVFGSFTVVKCSTTVCNGKASLAPCFEMIVALIGTVTSQTAERDPGSVCGCTSSYDRRFTPRLWMDIK